MSSKMKELWTNWQTILFTFHQSDLKTKSSHTKGCFAGILKWSNDVHGTLVGLTGETVIIHPSHRHICAYDHTADKIAAIHLHKNCTNTPFSLTFLDLLLRNTWPTQKQRKTNNNNKEQNRKERKTLTRTVFSSSFLSRKRPSRTSLPQLSCTHRGFSTSPNLRSSASTPPHQILFKSLSSARFTVIVL